MKFENVKYTNHGRTVLLRTRNSLILHLKSALFEGGDVTIDSAHDKFTKCIFDNCKIVSTIPLIINDCTIDHVGDIERTERVGKDVLHAIIDSCVFKSCRMPKADYYDYNILNGKPQSSNQKVKTK